MSGRAISDALKAHLQQTSTTTCRLLKIILRDGTFLGFTTLDVDITYDDGASLSSPPEPVVYSATNGFNQTTISADTGYTVDNAEAYALISDDVDDGITVQNVKTGRLNDARWICYLVNFKDMSMGHLILDAGDVGEVQTQYGMVWLPELLSYMTRLRQPVGDVWSRTCRATFGNLTQGQYFCGIDADALWVNATVTAVGSETDRSFQVDAFPSTLVTATVGRVRWLTGDNVGFDDYSIEEADTTGGTKNLSLDETTPFPIQVGDTLRIRPDCRKRFEEDCITLYSNGDNFKGEPTIPVGDAGTNQTPGAP